MPFAPPPLLAPPRRISRLAAIVLLSTITLAAAALVAASGRAAATARRTEVVQWSPFDARGTIKHSLAVKTVAAVGGCGDVGPGSEAIGDYGYRCGFANYIDDPCWRDGPGRTEHVICAADPWTRSVKRIRVPKLMLRVGVTFAGMPGPVWAIELMNGDRCTIAQGAHDTVTGRGTGLVVDYYCKSGIVLLRNLRRGGVWRIGSARFDRSRGRYRLLGDVRVRRAFYGGLPRAMRRENELARRAATLATAIVRRDAKARGEKVDADPLRVRLVLPGAEWANVYVMAVVHGTDRFRDRSVILKRTGHRWAEFKYGRSTCRRLPARARQQLFGTRRCT
jgi:hypothetical protein